MVKLKDLENWMGVGQMSKRLGRSRQGVINLLDEGRIRSVKTQIGWLADPDDVERFAREQEED
ncbi:MAG: helix-turn-helix domain-containing protein [Rubrobacter sp.]|nr:helix-turn-helix domain-containing protein [Rubrobacter sp.]MBA3791265.1 helix-turn-helix domain-containing protein [Rubrobacter sp.]